MADLKELAQKLLKDGPYKTEKTPRRIRGLLGGVYVFDTMKAVYVWEHGFYPYFYIPKTEFVSGVLERVEGNGEGKEEGFWLGTLKGGEKSTDRVLGFEKGELRGLVKIEVSALDAWFAEDEQLLGPHPKDPYKRIECLPSSREIRIEIEGTVVAKSRQNVFLYETGLRCRYYLGGRGEIEWGFLRESALETKCPYKGVANYYHLNVNGKEIKDAVWYYRYPTAESAAIAGRLCFYNEKVDVFIDGVKEEK